MAFNPVTDFIGLWRASAGSVVKLEMPGLDYVIAALARTGLITLSVGATAPVVQQSTTAWLQTAVPSNSAEGVVYLWDPITDAYVPATQALFLTMLQAAANQNGVSWYAAAGGPPINTVGNNGDYSVRTDEPGGIYGPKALGAWPQTPLPGSTDIISSLQLDLTFGTAEGTLLTRGPAIWQVVNLGAVNTLLTPLAGLPSWETLTALLDAVFGGTQGSILYRGAGAWAELPPVGTAGFVLTNNGLAANPSWGTPTPEFESGTVMVFAQSVAPTGWTQSTILNDYGMRVVSGSTGGGVTAGTGWSTVFAQTAVGNTTITQATMPSHTHSSNANLENAAASTGGGNSAIPGELAATINSTGGDGPHSHSVSLQLSYVDVILASKN